MIVGGHAVMTASRRWFMSMADHQGPPAMKPKWGHQPKVAMTAGTQPMHGNGMRVRSGRA
jgi:hypothetical protein